MLKLRLSMGGTKKRPVYKIVVADSRFPRDGRFIEKLGYFNPLLPKDKKDRVGLESERIKYWLSQGAKPTTRVARILGENKLIEMPAAGNNPNKAIPKKDRKKQDAGAEKKEDKKADAPKAERKKLQRQKRKKLMLQRQKRKKLMLQKKLQRQKRKKLMLQKKLQRQRKIKNNVSSKNIHFISRLFSRNSKQRYLWKSN